MPPPAQPRPQTLTSPLSLPEPPSVYDPADFQDIDIGIGRDPMISTTFIEAVAQSMGFSATDEDYRSSLHSVPKVRRPQK